MLYLIEEQRKRLSSFTQSVPHRWAGLLRRNTLAKAVQGSNTIEGYNATLDEAIAIIEDEPPLEERTEAWLALNGYQSAMTYILQIVDDPYFEFSKQLIKSLHFMMTSHDLQAFPGRWRPGAVYVINSQSNETVYDPPAAELLDELIGHLVEYLLQDSRQSAIVTAAMAHLNLTLIHPFKDGNGRMSRALQTLTLARRGVVHPVFSSIEEWLGNNTQAYYNVLAEVGQGSWHPENDARPWLRFCLRAHYQQAATIIRRFDEYDRLFRIIRDIVAQERIDQRSELLLFDCALGRRLTNARYQKDADVSSFIAGRDLKVLSDKGLINPHGEKRGRYYTAGKPLLEARQRTRTRRTLEDPYDVISSRSKIVVEPLLPGF